MSTMFVIVEPFEFFQPCTLKYSPRLSWSIEYLESVLIKIFFLKKSDPMDMDKAV